jgi:hypothetical protein
MPLQTDGYTFVLSDEVTRTPVRYKNRYGIEIAADLYVPRDATGRLRPWPSAGPSEP